VPRSGSQRPGRDSGRHRPGEGRRRNAAKRNAAIARIEKTCADETGGTCTVVKLFRASATISTGTRSTPICG